MATIPNFGGHRQVVRSRYWDQQDLEVKYHTLLSGVLNPLSFGVLFDGDPVAIIVALNWGQRHDPPIVLDFVGFSVFDCIIRTIEWADCLKPVAGSTCQQNTLIGIDVFGV